ncbi:MAG TPA: efflux RND transporter permease subunit [Negativicutes bacterium]|nr:efflux RND transporter permease subunit [Negativicutes bacterium]
MKKGVIYAAVKYRKITLFIVAFLLMLGMYSYYLLPRQEYTEITPPIALITTVYPGASPTDVDRLVTGKIEDEIMELPGYDYSDSTSKNSFSVVVLRMEKSADIEESWAELRRKMEDLQAELPQGCGKININTDLADTAGMIISMSGDNYSYEELAIYAGELEDDLSAVDGVSRFDIVGKQEKEVRIDVDAGKLNYLGVSMGELADILAAQNIRIPPGQVNDGNTRIEVSIPAVYSSVADIGNTIIAVSPQNGSTARLKDIAEVSMMLEDSNYKIKQNGKNAVLLTGYFKDDLNAILVGRDADKVIESFEARLPKDISFDKVLFQPEDINKSINDFVLNLFEGILFVVVVVFLSMGLRNALIVSVAIPVSMICTFIVMRFADIKLHQISVTALIIALGMLVDNAIVVSDAIQVRLDSGQERMEACVAGVSEVAIPIFTSTLTTVGAFIPLLLLSSVSGEYVKSVPQIVIISLSFSYLVALFVTPTMAYLFFKPGHDKEKVFRIKGFFDRLLQIGMRKKRKVVLLSILAFAIAMLLSSTLGLQFFPKADKNILYIDARTEQNSDISRTEGLMKEIEWVLKQQQEVTSYTAAVGDGLPKFYNAMPTYTQSQDFGQYMLRVDLKKGGRFKNNTQFVSYLQKQLDGSIAGGSITVKELEQGDPVGSPVTVRMTGRDMDRLGEAAEQVRRLLEDIPGTINVDDDFSDRIYKFKIKPDSDKAGMYGATAFDLQNEVNILLQGRAVSVFNRDGYEYNIVLKGNIKSIEDLENFRIKSAASGNKLLLKDIAEVGLTKELPAIRTHDGQLCVTVYSDVQAGYSAVGIENELKKRLEGMDLDDVGIVYAGERSKIIQYFGELGSSSVFAVFVIFAILMVQFNSFLQPLIIMLTIPLSIIGSVLGLFIFRQPLSFTALLGMVSLLGIVVNNAIILVDYINSERKLGKTIETACKDAVNTRFRPIMLTTTTTVIGLVPLVMSGSQLFAPMSISLVFGLMLSTLLTLVIIPVVYSLAESRFEACMPDNVSSNAQISKN